MYQLDGGVWLEYEDPFVVSDVGKHTVKFYSLDNAGNIEDEKSCIFTIKSPIELEIKGGLFKVSAVIKNIGTSELTGVNWKISLDGGALIGKVNEGEIPGGIPPGGQETVTSKIIVGFGKTVVTVDAWIPDGSSATKQQSGFILLFYIYIKPGGGQ